MYKKNYKIAVIRDLFHQKYPNDMHIFTVAALRSQIFRIIRMGIRKLYYFIANFGRSLPEMIALDDNRVKAILYNQDGLGSR